MRPQYILAGCLAAVVVALDQFTKYLVQKSLILWTGIDVIPGFFSLVHSLNKGSAFGFMNHAGSAWQPYFFIAVTAFAVVIILNLLSKAPAGDKLFIISLGLILGGAVGNLIDRVRLGEVVDFLDFAIGSFHWPAFNVADMAISLGSLALIVSFYRRGRIPKQ